MLEGNVAQFYKQCIGVGIVFGYCAIARLIILVVVKTYIGLRVTEETEQAGLDLALHGKTLQ